MVRSNLNNMKKHLILVMLSVAVILAGCSKEETEKEDSFTPPSQEQLTQNAYADNENTGNGFSFTTDAPWTATVNEVLSQSPTQMSLQAKSTTRSTEGKNVVWLKLYNGNDEAYSGNAGTITLRIEIDQNYTGERREATITIRSGNNTFTVTVVQEGTKQDGSTNDAPVKVTKITLDKTELALEIGSKATLTATIEPTDATIKSVIWSSSNSNIVKVNPVTGEMTAMANGTVTVTATSSSNKEVSASCKVIVGKEDPIGPDKLLISEIKSYSKMNPTLSYSNIKLTYDDKNRLTKWEEEGKDEGSIENQIITFEYDQNIVYITSIASTDDPDDPNTYTAYLNDAGFVIRTENTDQEISSFEYDSENRLIRMTQADEWQEYVWEDGNIVKIKYGDGQGETEITNYTYYAELENRMNIDLFFDRISWDEELVMAGLTGIPCHNMLQKERGESQWAYKDDFDMEYEIDENGYVIKAIQTQPQLSSSDEDYDPWISEISYISGK